MFNKKGEGFSMEGFIGWIIFGFVVLAIILLSIFILSGKATGMINFIKELFGFR